MKKFNKMKLKNVGAMIIALMLTLTNFASVYAASGSLSSAGGTGMGYTSNGRSDSTNHTSQFSTNNEMFVTEDGLYAWCLDPLSIITFGAKTKVDLLGYKGITQDDINYMAAVTDYCMNKASTGSSAERYMIAQKLCWDKINGKGYTATTSISGVSASTINAVQSAAHNFGLSSGGIGKGYLYQSAGSQVAASFTISYGGYVTLTKAVKNNKHLTDLCPENYSLAGAEYYVSTGNDGSGYVGALTTNETGAADILKVQTEGWYYVKEVKAPKGFKLDPEYHAVYVTAGQTATVNVSDEPVLDPLAWKVVTKKIAEGSDKNLSVKGAEFTVKYYNTLESIDGKEPIKTWTFLADENGFVKWKDEYIKEGSEPLLKDDINEAALPVGVLSIEESKAPKGLAKDDKVVYVKIEQLASGSDKTKRTFSDKPTFENPIDVAADGTAWEQIEKPQTVSITINKVDKETGKSEAQGHGSLAGAKYSVYKYNALEDKDEEVGEITTDEKGFGILEGLKPGLYKVKEILASAGYVIDSLVKEVRAGIKELNTANFNYDVKSEEQPITVKISKHSIDELGNKILVPGAVLEIKQGDKVIEEFTTTDKDKVLKALPVGKYTLHETKAPEGYFKAEDIEFTVEEKEDEQVVEMFDEPVPEIKTTANFDTGVKESLASEKVTVIDKVSYKKLVIGKEYEAKAKLVNRDNPDEVIATGSTKFTAEKSNGTVDVKLTFDASKLEGTTMVVFEDLYKNGKLLASHNDLTDEEQTVYIPSVKTKATDKVDDGKDMFADEKQTIVDTVKYTNLRVGQKYTVNGKLIEKETGKAVIDNGKEVTAEKTFIAEKANGEVKLEFTFNAKALKGKTIVVFEDLYNDKVKVATHSDIEDKEQSIYVPEIKTKADINGVKKIEPTKDVTVTDSVSYTNLLVGKEYTVKGKLMSKKTGKPFTVYGKEVIAEKTFTAEKADGEVKLEFKLNGEKLVNEDIVVFEKLYREDKLVGTHEDINDEGQTVKVLRIGEIKISDNFKLSGFSAMTGDRNNLLLHIITLILSVTTSMLVALLYKKKKME